MDPGYLQASKANKANKYEVPKCLFFLKGGIFSANSLTLVVTKLLLTLLILVEYIFLSFCIPIIHRKVSSYH